MPQDTCCNPAIKLLTERVLLPRRFFLLGMGSLTAALALGQRRTAQAQPAAILGDGPADTIYRNGIVITVNDAQPTASAVAVRGGLIVAVGDEVTVNALAGDDTTVIDLQGRTLVPGFFDPHGHVFQQGLAATVADLLPPPDGTVDTIAKLQSALAAWGETPLGQEAGWIIGNGYDDAQLAEQRHPTRADLDQVSTTVPIFIIHQSGHLGSLNSLALEVLGITADTPNPDGGVIRRQAGSQEPDGVLEENAFYIALTKMTEVAKPDPQEALNLVYRGAATYARYGFTTAQEGRATQGGYEAIRAAAAASPLPIDIAVYIDYVAHPDLHTWEDVGQPYQDRVRLAGAKLTFDGSPQGRTAWLSEPYYQPPEGQPADYNGYGVLSDEQARDRVGSAYAHNLQVLIHGNGDASIDQLLMATREATERYGGGDRRNVLIHGQTVRADQLDQMAELELFPALFPAHVFYWGDWHRDVTLGPERAQFISPTRAALDRGMKVTIHTDSPVVLPHATRTMWSAVNRRTRSGDILGEDQRLTPLEALKALTIWSAYQHFEEDSKGSIEVGKRADLAVLSDNPLTVEPMTIRDIEVLETIKDGQAIYTAGTLMGTVTYRQRIALPPHAQLVLRLEDISRADAPAVLVAEKTIDTAWRQVPLPFLLTYDPAEIDPRRRYGLRAQIFDDGELLWTSTQGYPVITQGHPTAVDIALEQVG